MYFISCVDIDGKKYGLRLGEYVQYKDRVKLPARSKVRKIVEKYVFKSNVDRVTDILCIVHERISWNKVKGGPCNRFLLVRICSALGCRVKECLTDIWPSYERRKHEYFLYSTVFPHMSIDTSNCVYYRDWADEVVRQSNEDGGGFTGNKWRSWEEYWEEHWRREESGEGGGFIRCGRVRLLDE